MAEPHSSSSSSSFSGAARAPGALFWLDARREAGEDLVEEEEGRDAWVAVPVAAAAQGEEEEEDDDEDDDGEDEEGGEGVRAGGASEGGDPPRGWLPGGWGRWGGAGVGGGAVGGGAAAGWLARRSARPALPAARAAAPSAAATAAAHAATPASRAAGPLSWNVDAKNPASPAALGGGILGVSSPPKWRGLHTSAPAAVSAVSAGASGGAGGGAYPLAQRLAFVGVGALVGGVLVGGAVFLYVHHARRARTGVSADADANAEAAGGAPPQPVAAVRCSLPPTGAGPAVAAAGIVCVVCLGEDTLPDRAFLHTRCDASGRRAVHVGAHAQCIAQADAFRWETCPLDREPASVVKLFFA